MPHHPSLHARSQRPAHGRIDEDLLEGPAWWCPWVVILCVGTATGGAFFAPSIRSIYVLAPLSVLAVGAAAAWRGIFRGNAPQRTLTILGIFLMMGLGAKIGKTFFAEELGQGISSAASTTGFTDRGE